jgi:hypothetical protein
MNAETRDASAQISETLSDLAASAAKAGGNLQSDLADKTARFSRDVTEKLGKAGLDTDSAKSAISDLVDRFGALTKETIRDRPIGALAAALVFGLFVGIAARR